jgi:hypothetical protein
MTIEDRNLKPGTTLVARYKGQEHTAEVVKTEDGIRYRLADGSEFKSPSSAGSAVMGGNACNGWRFWSVAGEDGKAPKREPKVQALKATKGSKIIKCGDCGKAYMTTEQLAHHAANAARLCKPHQGNVQAAQEAEAEAVA